MEPLQITINEIPRTKKNSQQIIYVNGHPVITQGKAYKQYEKACVQYMPHLQAPIDCPVNVKAFYYMPTRRRVDLCNLHAALHDILVKYHVLEDDNNTILVSTDGSRVLYDKYNPRTEVIITTVTE